ncbi:MAG: anaerobic ribonucleoside-triphosphate reductase activating protein [Clostridium sp.]|uniref:anaerobic ribonucleoside-triphosphate reductase activating protein n=1 Tax=Clostridium sp. TaxID=1506 RepID=UPI00290FF5D8|nr:anaerobic ribonucleoside-triphosphate reductase activating protein [Clostridium sp.]MDU7338850.1 anaerobic ribonucleoside-triphosphate reductase activating protein [Clostridium sp.]
MLMLSGIEPESIVDGAGIRYVIFVQGCPHHCPGCHNPKTHPFKGGAPADIPAILAEIKENPLLKGVTFSGGEPFCQAEELVELAKKIRSELPRLDITVYSGYTLEQLQAMRESGVQELLKQADWLIDGMFLQERRDLTLRFRGSQNQRIIDLRGSEPIIVE